MSKLCRYVKILQVIFVKMVQVQNNFSRRTRLHHLLLHATNASLIIEHGKRVTKQSEDWLMTTSNPKSYLRGVINLVNSLRLLYPLYSFVPQLYTNLLGFGYKSSPNIECTERLMRQNENITMIISTSVTDLMIDTSLVNQLRLLCLV